MRSIVRFRSRVQVRGRIATGAVVTALLLGVTAVTGCSSSAASSPSASSTGSGAVAYDEPVLKVTDAYVRQPPTAGMAAAYLTVTNTGRLQGRLIGVTSDMAGSVSMNRTTASHQMVSVTSLTIPARGRLVLRSGGDHLMLTGLRKKPTAGETVTLRLRFAASGTITVRAPVEPMTYQPRN
ncbi:copper chaperone PCu(A)C [Streptomyces sp. NPDC047028]|uniref:copper chaperone PCu(A)C n=1 Tax=Streptomyces sp. NPDC047028 TaxID=3155793 RepID=UPI0033BFC64D